MNSPQYAVIAAEFNKPLIDAMLAVAIEAFRQAGHVPRRIVRVPGAYELPLMASVELAKPDIAGLIVLGYIEKGETLHGEVMGHVVCRALVEIQLKEQKPIGLGIIGPGATAEQAQVRHVGCATAAVKALLHVDALLRSRV